MTDAPQILLNHHLKTLKLPTFLREYEKQARPAADAARTHVCAHLRAERRRGAGSRPVPVPPGRNGKAREWRSKVLPRYRHLTKSEQDQTIAWGAVFPTIEALMASVYLSATTRRHRTLPRASGG